MSTRNAIIFGISGQDGSYLARLLLGKGYRVWGTSRDHQGNSFDNLNVLSIRDRIHLLSSSPDDFATVVRAIETSDPSEIYFLAGQSSVSLSYEQPAQTIKSSVTGILNLLEACRLIKPKAKIYHASSSECFGNVSQFAANEQTPFQPVSPYAVAKASATWLVKNYRDTYGMFACNGILFNHESPLRPARFVTQKIIQTAKRIGSGSDEKLTLGRLDISRDWGWSPEYVDAMWRMLQIENPQDFVIATGVTNPLRKFVEYAFGFFDLEWSEHVNFDDRFRRPSDIEFSYAEPLKAKAILNWSAETMMPQVVEKMIANDVHT